ncbi:MAG: penicillin acylase family protein, partial [Cyanobacteria bacterium P01_A01_bin.135]
MTTSDSGVQSSSLDVSNLAPALLGRILDEVTPALGPTDLALGVPLDVSPLLSLLDLGDGAVGSEEPEELAAIAQTVDSALEELRNAGRSLLDVGALTAGPLAIAGLTEAVTVERDSAGVVHIRAENNADLFTALGFVHASDRLWQMDFQRRLVAGNL